MQNSIGLNKNILILTIVLFALVAALSVMLGISKISVFAPAPVLKGNITQAMNRDVIELNNLDADLTLSAKDNIVNEELDTTLSEVGEISGSSTSLTDDEKDLAGLDSDLTDLSNNDKINSEIDQSLKDASL